MNIDIKGATHTVMEYVKARPAAGKYFFGNLVSESMSGKNIGEGIGNEIGAQIADKTKFIQGLTDLISGGLDKSIDMIGGILKKGLTKIFGAASKATI